MKTIIFIYVMATCAWSFCCRAIDTNAVLASLQGEREAILKKTLPEDYTAFKRNLIGNGGVSDARTMLALLSKAKEAVDQARLAEAIQKDRLHAYHAAWSFALLMWQQSSNQQAKQLILDHWNRGLSENGVTVAAQVYSLADVWDRQLLTESFWQLLRTTDKRRILSAVCYVLYRHGDSADMKELMMKRDSGIDADVQEIIQNAINWMKFRRSWNRGDPGPAALPPRMEY